MDYLTVKQVAEMLGTTPRTIARWIGLGENGPFPGAYQLPGGIRSPFLIPVSEVEAELERRRSSSKEGEE